MMSSRWGSDLAHDGRSKSVWFEPSGRGARSSPTARARSSTSTPSSSTARRSPTPSGCPSRCSRVPAAPVRRAAPLPLRGPAGAAAAGDDRARGVPARHRDHRHLRPRRPRAPRQRRHLAARPGDRRRRADSVDLEYSVPVTTPATMARIRDLLDEVYHAVLQRAPARAAAAGGARGPAELVLHRVRAPGQGRGAPRPLDGSDLDASCMTARRLGRPSPLLGVLLPGSAAPWARWPGGGSTDAFPVATGHFPWVVFADQRESARRCWPRSRCCRSRRRVPWVAVFLGTGILGGFTTMSAASVDTFTPAGRRAPGAGAGLLPRHARRRARRGAAGRAAGPTRGTAAGSSAQEGDQ